jgi:hypothetical protein
VIVKIGKKICFKPVRFHKHYTVKIPQKTNKTFKKKHIHKPEICKHPKISRNLCKENYKVLAMPFKYFYVDYFR